MKSWKEMNQYELLNEIIRVKELLKTNKNYFTQKQNKKYLEKLEREYRSLKNGN